MSNYWLHQEEAVPKYINLNKNPMKQNKNFQRKSQLKIGETIFVLMIFFIMMTLGAVFYVKIQSVSGNEEQQKQLDLRTIKIAEQVKSLPEIVCTQSAIQEFDCIDLIKLTAFSTMMNNQQQKQYKQYYSQVFTNVNIKVQQLYPAEISYPLFSNTAVITKGAKKSVSTIFLPVTLFDPIKNENSFGIITVEVMQNN